MFLIIFIIYYICSHWITLICYSTRTNTKNEHIDSNMILNVYGGSLDNPGALGFGELIQKANSA